MDGHSWTRVAISPTAAQATTLSHWLDALTRLRHRFMREMAEDRRTFAALSREIKTLRHEAPYDTVPTTLLRSTAHVVDKRYQAGKRTPRPCQALEFVGTGWSLKQGGLAVKPLGVLTTRGRLPADADKLTIAFHGGRWTAFLRTVPATVTPPLTGKDVGIDLGVRSLAITSGGYFVNQHPSLVALRRKLTGHRHRLKRATPGSRRWREHQRCIERTEDRIRACQADLAHKTAVNLLARYDTIFLEAVNVNGAGIQQHPIYRQACHDAGWQLFTDILTHHAANAVGKRCVLVPAYFSSQTCSRCDRYAPKRLEDRTHRCPHCGLVLDRDVNAARTLKKRGELILGGDAVFSQDWTPKGHPRNPI